jgi:hypothetical protein
MLQHPLAAALIVTLLLAGCGAGPKIMGEPPQPTREQAQIDLGDGFRVDYQVERKISTLNQRTCYAFITGTIQNDSRQTLSRQSVLDVIVTGQGKQLFRDLTNPVSDIPPGGRVMFGMVDSPVHKSGCPTYDRITMTLRKVLAN